MKYNHPVLALLLLLSTPVWPQAATPVPLAGDMVVVRVGDIALTKAEYEKLVPGFDRAAGAVTTGASTQSLQSGQEVARMLALVSEAQRRKIDQDPKMQAVIRVRTYVLLANALLVSLKEDMQKDEAGTRALWASEKNNYIDVRARQILIRYQGVKADKTAPKGITRTEAQAKAAAAAAYAKLKAGADFSALAKASSDDEGTLGRGGELPPFTRGAMVNEFEAVAFGQPVGVVSEPFKSKYGYHIVEVMERRPFPFEKVRASLEFIRAKQKFEEIAASGIQLNDAYFKP